MEPSELLISARSTQQKGDKAEATKLYQKLMDSFPETPEAKEAKAELKYLTESKPGKGSQESDLRSPDKNSQKYKSSYGTARLVSLVISFFGWFIIIVGGFGIFLGLEVANKMTRGDMAILGTLPGITVIIFGILLVAAGQITRATVDNADHTGELLHLTRNSMK